MFMKFTPTADISSSDDEGYLVKFCELVYLVNELFDMIMVKSLTTIAESLTREFE
jgi:hypothetical protein